MAGGGGRRGAKGRESRSWTRERVVSTVGEGSEEGVGGGLRDAAYWERVSNLVHWPPNDVARLRGPLSSSGINTRRPELSGHDSAPPW